MSGEWVDDGRPIKLPGRERRAIGNCEATGKSMYPSEDAAILALRGMRENAAKKGLRTSPVRVYQCPNCDAWHTTAKPSWNPGREPRTRRNAD